MRRRADNAPDTEKNAPKKGPPMSLNIGIISSEGYEYPPTRRLVQAAAARGHRIVVVDPSEVWPAICAGEPGLVGPTDAADLDVVLPRQGATVLDSSLTLVAHFTLMGIPLVNNLDGIRLVKDQFLTLQALSADRVPVPDTVFVNNRQGFMAALKQLENFPVVIKQVNSRVGEGVFLAKNEKEGQRILDAQMDPSRGLLIQQFIPPGKRQDIRVLVIGNSVAGAMELRPRDGDFRANFHLSQQSWPIELTGEMESVALKAAAAVRLEIAGVDLIADRDKKIRVIEVNYSPGFTGLEAATGTDIAGRIVDYLAENFGKR